MERPSIVNSDALAVVGRNHNKKKKMKFKTNADGNQSVSQWGGVGCCRRSKLAGARWWGACLLGQMWGSLKCNQCKDGNGPGA